MQVRTPENHQRHQREDALLFVDLPGQSAMYPPQTSGDGTRLNATREVSFRQKKVKSSDLYANARRGRKEEQLPLL